VQWTDILRCPETGQSLHFDEAASALRGEASDVTYPVIDGIVDFCPQAQDRIAASYNKAAARYDPGITASTLPTKVLGWIIWGRASDRDPMEKVLSLLPERFDGVLLDAPVGTGVFTALLYRRYPAATIIGVDCSMNMLRRAQARFREQSIPNVHLLKADAAHLPVRDAAADLVLSMNGWHAFADKQRTTAEMRRVLRREGTLIACGYVRGARWLSDWFVRHFGVRNGFFTPPFWTPADLARQFQDFTMARQGNDKSIAWFEALKGGAPVAANTAEG
jgi:SAM-dependent methyltransferase